MPLLSRQTELHPQNLFEGAELVDARWSVAYVRSRQEKALARHLLHQDVPYYLPTWEKHHRSSGRTRVSFLPLFPGYVFYCGQQARRRVLESNLLVKILEVEDQPCLHQELADLWALQASGASLVPHPYLEAEDEVRIVDGPFKGWTGRVLREKGRFRLVVSVTFLRRSVAAELDRNALVPASLASGLQHSKHAFY